MSLPNRDLSKLHPAFRARVELLLLRLKARGFDPFLHEAHRSFQRAAELEARGTGVSKSMHCFGLAVDIIDRKLGWNARPEFWEALRDEAEALSLTSGARWHRVDRPHVQALPAKLDRWVRASKATVVFERVSRLLPPLPLPT